MPGKLIGLKEAAALVPDGATLSFGGFTTQRHPMAFVYELIRLKRRDLYLFGHSPGGDWDILIGAGCVKRVELAYEADEAFNTVGPRWRRAVERGEIEWEDYSNFSMVARFTAGAMGIPFMPVRSLLGSDVVRKEALDARGQRRPTPARRPKKLHVMESPFDPADRVVLVPAIHTDFAVLHVQKATAGGHGADRRADLRRRPAGPLRRHGHRHGRGDRRGGRPAPRAGAQPAPLLRRQARLPCPLRRPPLRRLQLL